MRKENDRAVVDAKKPLQTKIPSADSKKPPRYILELRATQTVNPISDKPIQKVEIPLERISPQSSITGGEGDDTGVIIERPPLQSLLPIEVDISSFSLDSRFIEKIGLPDVLNMALAQNLDIEEGFSRTKIQKFQLLSRASQFLPTLNGGYSLFGITGDVPTALFGGGAQGSSSQTNAGLPSTIQLLNAGFTQNVYTGGRILYGTLEQKHRARASRAALKTDVNDTLLQATNSYYDLLLNEALLSIRTRAVAISQEQVRLNAAQHKAGTATALDVLQSRAQLASDEQNLINQQKTRRQAAIRLSHVLNSSLALDLESGETHLRKRRLIPKSVKIDKLLLMAIERRPELKQYEELRLAAKRAIVVAAAPLQPNVTFGGTIYGIGAGSSSLDKVFTLNLGVNWTLGGLGTTDIANMQRARWEARQAAIQAKKQFLDVFEQVRTSYTDSLAADRKIERATVQIAAAEEELRIAKKRMDAGIGLNINVINAQRDLTQARINKAQAVVEFNISQAQMLRNIGSISSDEILNGLKI
ncbi:MAG: TolC family protein [Candidatus Obscuribacterales bacterium]|nr:TolC family protein [Candidatus Obscuribacterales bacterium]MCC7530011.1 TolC family protein [Candidatus Melainabacteria bacterium]